MIGSKGLKVGTLQMTSSDFEEMQEVEDAFMDINDQGPKELRED